MMDRSNEPETDAVGANQHHLLRNLAGDAHHGSEYPFPVKLHYMLNDVEEKGLDHIVSWLPNGEGFIIRNPKEAAKHILPIWFRQNSYGSFQRQLNLYNFTRIKSGSAKGGYCHELFMRGKPALSYAIKRVPIKNAKKRTTAANCLSNRSEVASSFNMKIDDLNTRRSINASSEMACKPFEFASSTAVDSGHQWPQSSQQANLDQRKVIDCVAGARRHLDGSSIPDIINSHMKPLFINKKSAIASSFSSIQLVPQSRSREDQGGDGKQYNTAKTSGLLTALGKTRFPETMTELGVADTRESTTKTCSFSSIPSSSFFCMDFDVLEENPSLPSLSQQSERQQQRRRSSNNNDRARVRRSSSYLFLKDLLKDMEGSNDFLTNNCTHSCHHTAADGDYEGQSSCTSKNSWKVVYPAMEPEMSAQIIQTFLY